MNLNRSSIIKNNVINNFYNQIIVSYVLCTNLIFDSLLTVIGLCENSKKHGMDERRLDAKSILSTSRVKAKILVLIFHLFLLLWSQAEQQDHKETKFEDKFKDFQPRL